jgi:hypothetical protein
MPNFDVIVFKTMLKLKHISLFFAAAVMLLVMESCSKLDPIEPMDQDGVSLEKGKHINSEETIDINALQGRNGDDFGRPDDGGVNIEDIDNVNDDDDEENDDEEQTLSID